MAFATATKNTMLDAIAATLYVQLHVGAPGANGTASPATTTTRKEITLAAAANGRRLNANRIEWVPVTTTGPSESISYLSLWDQLVGGTYVGDVELDPALVIYAGGNFVINVGGIALTVSDS